MTCRLMTVMGIGVVGESHRLFPREWQLIIHMILLGAYVEGMVPEQMILIWEITASSSPGYTVNHLSIAGTMK